MEAPTENLGTNSDVSHETNISWISCSDNGSTNEKKNLAKGNVDQYRKEITQNQQVIISYHSTLSKPGWPNG